MRVHVIRNSACQMLKHRTADIGLRQRGEREQRRHSAAHVDRAEVYSNGHFLAKIWQPRIGSTWEKKAPKFERAHLAFASSCTPRHRRLHYRQYHRPRGSLSPVWRAPCKVRGGCPPECWLFGRDCSILLCRPLLRALAPKGAPLCPKNAIRNAVRRLRPPPAATLHLTAADCRPSGSIEGTAWPWSTCPPWLLAPRQAGRGGWTGFITCVCAHATTQAPNRGAGGWGSACAGGDERTATAHARASAPPTPHLPPLTHHSTGLAASFVALVTRRRHAHVWHGVVALPRAAARCAAADLLGRQMWRCDGGSGAHGPARSRAGSPPPPLLRGGSWRTMMRCPRRAGRVRGRLGRNARRAREGAG